MRLNRTLLGIVGLLAIGGTSACGVVATTHTANAVQAAGVSVEISPNRTPAGAQIAVRANCADGGNSATITSPAFGTIAAQQTNTSSTLLSATVDVPGSVTAGSYDVTVTCHSGAVATTRLIVTGAPTARPTVGPHTGGGFLAGQNSGGTFTAASPWLLGSAATLILAAALGAFSLRRRRRRRPAPVAPADEREPICLC